MQIGFYVRNNNERYDENQVTTENKKVNPKIKGITHKKDLQVAHQLSD